MSEENVPQQSDNDKFGCGYLLGSRLLIIAILSVVYFLLIKPELQRRNIDLPFNWGKVQQQAADVKEKIEDAGAQVKNAAGKVVSTAADAGERVKDAGVKVKEAGVKVKEAGKKVEAAGEEVKVLMPDDPKWERSDPAVDSWY